MVFDAAMRTPLSRGWKRGMATTLSLLLCAGLALAGCSGKDEHSVLGKWQSGNDLMVSFGKDGYMTKQQGITTEQMEYSVQNGTTLYVKPKDLPMSLEFELTFPSDNELVLTPKPPAGMKAQAADQAPVHLTRVKE